MPATRKTNPRKPAPSTDEAPRLSVHLDSFASAFSEQIRAIIGSGLTPSSALDLVMRLIAEVPTASKEAMDHIKMLDKLINTARSMIETKLKSEEAIAITLRLDELERRIDELVAVGANRSTRPEEVRDDRVRD